MSSIKLYYKQISLVIRIVAYFTQFCQSIMITDLGGMPNEERTLDYQETRRGRQPHYLCPYQGRHLERSG